MKLRIEAIPALLVDAVHDGLYRIDLIRAHDHELLLAREQHHVAADGPPELGKAELLFW